MPLPLEIRDPRLPGGRLSVQSGTDDPAERDRFRASILTLLDREDAADIVRRLRLTKRQPGKLLPAQVHQAVQAVRAVPSLRLEDVLRQIAPTAVEAEAAGYAGPMLAATADRFLRRIKAKRRERTLMAYTSLVDNICAHFGVVRDPRRVEDGRPKILHDVPMAGIGAEGGEKWLHGPKVSNGGRAWSPARQKIAHAVAHQVWDLAIAAELDYVERAKVAPRLLRNIFAVDKRRITVRPPRVPKTRKRFLSPAEAGRMLWATRGTPAAAYIALGVYAGLRPDEKRQLRVGPDLDLRHSRIRVQPREGDYAWAPKTDNGVRDVPVGPTMARWLRAHVRAGYAGRRFVFRAPDTDAPPPESMTRRWVREACEASGIAYGRDDDGVTDHTFRHTCASWMAQANVQLLKIAEILGDTHEEIAKTYAHLLPTDLADAVNQLTPRSRRARG